MQLPHLHNGGELMPVLREGEDDARYLGRLLMAAWEEGEEGSRGEGEEGDCVHFILYF